MGGKVLVPTQEQVQKLTSARLAADIMGTSTIVVARTDAEDATLLTNDVDPTDQPFVTGERTFEGFHRVRAGIEPCIARARAYAPYADVIWCETKAPDLDFAKQFADAVHEQFPGKLLAYNCSPSFNWAKKLDAATIRKFQNELGAMGYKFQFITLAGFHALNYSMFRLARDYRDRQMEAYVELQQAEFGAEAEGYTATRHQREVGAGYFDSVSNVVTGGLSSVGALAGSTEEAQFSADDAAAGEKASADATGSA
jgi:isocitrate lyase